MNLDQRITSIRQEIGKSRKDRGLKYRQVTIRFEEFFRDKIFETLAFDEWKNQQPELMEMSSATARTCLQKAGTRDDMPRPFELVRVGKSAWVLRPPENYLLSGMIPKEMIGFFKRIETKVNKLLQAVDWDNLDRFTRFAVVTQYQMLRSTQDRMRLDASTIQLTLDQWNDELPLLKAPGSNSHDL